MLITQRVELRVVNSILALIDLRAGYNPSTNGIEVLVDYIERSHELIGRMRRVDEGLHNDDTVDIEIHTTSEEYPNAFDIIGIYKDKNGTGTRIFTFTMDQLVEAADKVIELLTYHWWIESVPNAV